MQEKIQLTKQTSRFCLFACLLVFLFSCFYHLSSFEIKNCSAHDNFLNFKMLRCKCNVQWNPAITKCHVTEKNVRYSGVFVIAKTPL